MKPKTYRPWYIWICLITLVFGIVASVFFLEDSIRKVFDGTSLLIGNLWILAVPVWFGLSVGYLIYYFPKRVRIEDEKIAFCMVYSYCSVQRYERKWAKMVEITPREVAAVDFQPQERGRKYASCEVLLVLKNGGEVGFNFRFFPKRKNVLHSFSEWCAVNNIEKRGESC